MKLSLLVTPFSDENLQLAAQAGVTDIVSIYPGLELQNLLEIRNRVESFGLNLGVVERYVPTLDFVHGTGDRDAQIEGFKTLVRNMGEAGVPVLCYSWMPDDDWQRTSLEVKERGGALVTEFDIRNPETFRSVTGFDFDPSDPTPASALWENLEYFLNEVIPVAEDAGVKLAMHPDDPPMGRLRGQDRILSTPEAFERLVAMVDSPSNGICFCQGSFASHKNEYDIPGLIERLAPHITFAHFRDVVGAVPHFTESFHDTGKTDMAAAMKAYLDAGVDCPIRPDHVPTLAGETNEFPGYHMLGRLWAVGYMRGILDTWKAVPGS
ncbi:MAG: mannonate dehydratase [Verrucomicrobiales bacterium]|nr:mannonate dehydratase [Verrucomicrobiales bacterium]